MGTVPAVNVYPRLCYDSCGSQKRQGGVKSEIWNAVNNGIQIKLQENILTRY